MNDSPPTASVTDRFAALRKAQEALSAIDKGQAQPAVTSKPVASSTDVKKPPRVFKARAPAQPLPSMASAIVSKPYDPSTAAPAPERFSPRLVPTKDTSLGFHALKLAHQKVGRDVLRQDGDAPIATSGAPVVAMDKKFFEDVSNQAKLDKLYKLVDQTAAYYKADPFETQLEKDHLATLSPADLEGMAVAFEVAATHVKIMTSDSYAQQVALESKKELKSFYLKHGTTEDQVDNERSERQAHQAKSKPKR